MKDLLNICQVSLKGNIPLIKENLDSFNKFYKNNRFFIICPKKEKYFFEKKLNYKNVKIIDENRIITFKNFKKIANYYLKKKDYFFEIQQRLTWYYQQILKITYIIDFIKKNKQSMIIWDADTVILKEIKFFNDNFSTRYGTTNEFYKAYYLTNKKILKKLPTYFISSLTQFICLTHSEADYLVKKLFIYNKKNKNIPEWITHIVFKSITSAHNQYNGSMFSEYELIGQSNLLKKYKGQKLISGMRDHLDGKLTKFQKQILVFFGYKYVAYEHTHINKNSKNMLNREQSWAKFIYLLVKKTINKILRGIKHYINLLFM